MIATRNRKSFRSLLGAALLVCAPAAAPAQEPQPAAEATNLQGEPEVAPEKGAVYARLRHLEGGISMRREDDAPGQTSQLAVNSPLIPGDQVWTGEDGRIEVQLADGSLLRLDRNSRLSILNLADREATFDNTTLVRLQNGSLYVRADGFDPQTRRFQIDTPAGSVFLLSTGVFRVDVGAGGVTSLSSFRGVAEIVSEDASGMVHSGERLSVEPGTRPGEAHAFNTMRRDPFDVWSESLDDAAAMTDSARGPRPEVPEPVRPYVNELGRYGVWRNDPSYGWIWIPDGTDDDWRPYYYGQWSYAPIGPVWVSYEPWGWAPYHYGRWQWGIGLGWFWSPGYVYSGAYVSWAIGPGYYGWCPLGYWGAPVYWGGYYPWAYVPYGAFYYPYVHRHVYSWSDIAHGRYDNGRVILRSHPVGRPGYSLENAGRAAYRRATTDPRVAVGRVEPGRGQVSFKDDDQRKYRQVIGSRGAPRGSVEPKAIHPKAGAPPSRGISPKGSPSSPGPSLRQPVSRGSVPGNPRMTPVSGRPAGGPGVSPATGRQLSAPVRPTTPRVLPRRPTAPPSKYRELAPEPDSQAPRTRTRVTTAPPRQQPGVTVNRQAQPHPRVEPGNGGRARPPFVMPSGPPREAPKAAGARPSAPAPRPTAAPRSGGGSPSAKGGQGKKGGHD